MSIRSSTTERQLWLSSLRNYAVSHDGSFGLRQSGNTTKGITFLFALYERKKESDTPKNTFFGAAGHVQNESNYVSPILQKESPYDSKTAYWQARHQYR